MEIIVIIIWLVQWTLPFPQAPSTPVDFVLNEVEWSDIEYSCVEPSLARSAWSHHHQHHPRVSERRKSRRTSGPLICGFSPSVRGTHWIWVFGCSPQIDQHVRCGQRTRDVWYRWCAWVAASRYICRPFYLKSGHARKFAVCNANTSSQMLSCSSTVVEWVTMLLLHRKWQKGWRLCIAVVLYRDGDGRVSDTVI